METVKILAICVIAAMVCILFRQQRPDFSFLISALTVVIITTVFLTEIVEPIEALIERIDNRNIELSYFKIALKALGIGYITNFCSNICKDAGQHSLSSIAETVGKCSIFILSVPLIINIIDLAVGFIK